MSEEKIEVKKIKASQLLNDIKSGLTRWKKDDKGFGSIEEKYGYTFTEMKQVINFPKLAGVKTLIPTLIIEDDIPDTKEKEETREEVPVTAKIEIATNVATEVKKNKVNTPFI